MLDSCCPSAPSDLATFPLLHSARNVRHVRRMTHEVPRTWQAPIDALLDELAVRVVDEIERRQSSRPQSAEPPPAEPVPEVLGAQEAAAYLRVGVNRMRDMLQTGEIEGWRGDGERRWSVSRAALDRYIARQEGRDGLTVIGGDGAA